MPLDFDAVIRLHIKDPARLVSEFSADWYKGELGGRVQESRASAVRKRGMSEMAINASVIDEIDKEVSKAIIAYVNEGASAARTARHHGRPRQSSRLDQEPARRDRRA